MDDIFKFTTDEGSLVAMPRENLEALLHHEITTWENEDGELETLEYRYDHPAADDGYYHKYEASGVMSFISVAEFQSIIGKPDDPDPEPPTPIAKKFVPQQTMEAREPIAISPFVNKPDIPLDAKLWHLLSWDIGTWCGNDWHSIKLALQAIGREKHYSEDVRRYARDLANDLIRTPYKSQAQQDFADYVTELRAFTKADHEAYQNWLKRDLYNTTCKAIVPAGQTAIVPYQPPIQFKPVIQFPVGTQVKLYNPNRQRYADQPYVVADCKGEWRGLKHPVLSKQGHGLLWRKVTTNDMKEVA